jgi:hypothetical protein
MLTAEYVMLQIKIGWRIVRNMLVWLNKMVLAQECMQLCCASLLGCKGHNKPKHLPEKRVMNRLWLLVPVSDCVIIMIGPGGLSLVTPDLFAVPILALWVRLEYSKETSLHLDVRQMFAGWPTEYHWRCS